MLKSYEEQRIWVSRVNPVSKGILEEQMVVLNVFKM